MIIGGSASQKLAAKVANELGDVFCPLETKKFPDGERYLRVKGMERGRAAERAEMLKVLGISSEEYERKLAEQKAKEA